VKLESLRILDPDGRVCRPELEPVIPGPELRRMLAAMIESSLLDERLLRFQRQGRIGFYLTAWGEEATLIGPVWALRPTDWIFSCYREQAAALFRGSPMRTSFRRTTRHGISTSYRSARWWGRRSLTPWAWPWPPGSVARTT
jgi:pyruvate dehydrogenase E1 component alpha subunit